jgi:UDP-glucuronate 4-epimerase
MTILVTGAAGFIGYHVTKTLLRRGERVLGLDNVNAYYDVALKEARLADLKSHNAFEFIKLDLADHEGFARAMAGRTDVTKAIHLAAQAGVRYSLDHPFAYVDANLTGHMTILEFCRHQKGFEGLVYASSSSVYGGNTKLPFSVDDRTDTPISLYAATKRANELMSHCYAHLYGIPQTGLRFFTVYGPWGRPDMALYIFTKAILAGQPLPVFNNGDMKRDFTYVDDIVAGVIAAADTPPSGGNGVPHRLYNIGNHRSEPLMRVIELLEKALGKKAQIRFEPMQPGDVKETFADISAIERDLGYAPTTTVDEGIPKFVAWYRQYHGV